VHVSQCRRWQDWCTRGAAARRRRWRATTQLSPLVCATLCCNAPCEVAPGEAIFAGPPVENISLHSVYMYTPCSSLRRNRYHASDTTMHAHTECTIFPKSGRLHICMYSQPPQRTRRAATALAAQAAPTATVYHHSAALVHAWSSAAAVVRRFHAPCWRQRAQRRCRPHTRSCMAS
jgi:hypothetical protein